MKKSFAVILSIILLSSILSFASAMNGDPDPNGSPTPSNSPAPICGNDIVEEGEQCDDGELNGLPNQCNSDCADITASVCGNNILEAGEVCEDGNTQDGDGCSDSCQIQNIAPVCSVDSMENDDTENQFFFEESIYINEKGDFTLSGSSSDADSEIKNVQYTRSDDFNTFPGQNAIPSDGAFNKNEEQWKSNPNDPDFDDGNHTICCRASDGDAGPETCQEFCIDTLNPDKTSIPQAQITRGEFDETCTPNQNYINSERDKLSFSWTEVSSNGCSPIHHYEIQFKDSVLTSPTNSIEISSEDLSDGDMISIKVRAIDAAGNAGDWSELSAQIVVDNTSPEAEITNNDDWINMLSDKNLIITEVDTDNNLMNCFYKVNVVNGETTIDFTQTVCNQPFTINTDTACPIDGDNICRVSKKVQDKACNVNNPLDGSRLFDLDRVAPITTKTVNEPKHPGFLWMNVLVDWFVKDTTTVVLLCQDDPNPEDNIETSGCKETWYKVTPNMTEFELYEGPFSIGDEDGLYTIEYYSVDNAGNQEQTQSEVDKLDIDAPNTTKTIGQPQFIDEDNRTWVNGETQFMLTCVDDEVGCKESHAMTSVLVEGIPTEMHLELENNNFTLNGLQDGTYLVHYWSIDMLGNVEEHQSEIDWLDNTPPMIDLENPNEYEAENVQACYQSIVAAVNDEGSGIKRVWTELWNSTNNLVRTENLTLRNDGHYEVLMDKQLPAGHYILKVYAEDNLGNVNSVMMEEHLEQGIFVEFLNPATCSVNTELGGSCKFTYNVCMRSANSVEFWLDKLGIPGVPPGLMNATISKGQDFANVGYLANQAVSPLEPSNLLLSEDLINGRTTFDLNLHIPADTASQIGSGAHKLKYLIEAFASID